jgi:hypothetical protein
MQFLVQVFGGVGGPDGFPLGFRKAQKGDEPIAGLFQAVGDGMARALRCCSTSFCGLGIDRSEATNRIDRPEPNFSSCRYASRPEEGHRSSTDPKSADLGSARSRHPDPKLDVLSEARRLLDRVGSRVSPRAKVAGLSIGQRQQVEIANALP